MYTSQGSEPAMQNEIRLEENTNIIYSLYHGDQTAVVLGEVIDAAKPMIQKLREQGKPVCLIVNTSDIKHQDAAARKLAAEAINTLDYDKLAICCAPLMIKHIIQFIIKASLKQDRVRYFDTEQAARDWIAGT